MKAIDPAILGLLCISCSAGKPSEAAVSRIESLTSKYACVGALDRWHREFQFQQRRGTVNRGVVSVLYVEAGHRGLPAGRFVTEPRNRRFDDTQHRVAGGEYDIASDRLTEWECGCNFPPYEAAQPVECKDGLR
jgi:hypothetical protein